MVFHRAENLIKLVTRISFLELTLVRFRLVLSNGTKE